jgi:hypothetical protein
MRRTTRIAAVVLGILGLTAIPLAANATPSRGATLDWETQTTVGNTTYILQQVTLAPGGTTGWHWNNGVGYQYVVQGTVTEYKADCTLEGVNKAGNSYTEPSGPSSVHVGLNLGTVPIVADFFYIIPAGTQANNDVPNPGCDFQ